MQMAEDEIIDLFDETVSNVAQKIADDTHSDLDSATYIAKMITLKSAAEGRDLEDIIEEVERWALDQSAKKILLTDVIAQISEQIIEETGAAADLAVVQA